MSFGQTLRAAREAKGLTTSELAASTHLLVQIVEGLENEDFQDAAVYSIDLTNKPLGLMNIDYQGDCARLYANGKLVADHFNNGRPFLYGLWRMPEGCNQLELRILPMQPKMPVYLPREADKTPGERVKRIIIQSEETPE